MQTSIGDSTRVSSAYAIDTLPATFRLVETERRFQHHQLARDVVQAVAFLCIASTVFLLWAFVDWNNFAATHPEFLPQIYAYRIGVAISCLAAAFAVRKYRARRVLIISYYAMITVMVSLFGLIVPYYLQTGVSRNISSYALLIMICYLAYPATVRQGTAAAVLISAIALGFHVFVFGSTSADCVNLIVTCAFMILICAPLSGVFQRSLRKDFVNQELLERSNERLQQEVTERLRAEDQLREYQHSLEDQVQERTDALRESERKLYVAQRVESLGQLAGGIAHDFNNLLVIISGYADLALQDPNIGEELKSNIHEIRLAGERAASLTRQLLVFGSQKSSEVEAVDVNELLGGLHTMLARLIPENITLDLRRTEEQCIVRGDSGQLEQIVVNLAVNSRDAMVDSGRLTLQTRVTEFGAEVAAEHPWAEAGQYVWLSVSDTGSGMTPETQQRIFDPFFTTKEHGKGTGLGMSIVFGIVRQHDGFIRVESVVGTGTTIDVYLPRLEQTAESTSAVVEVEITTGDETVLLAEDNEQVRDLASKILSAAGYEVISAEDGLAAVEIFSDEPTRFDLVLLDLVMPKMGGLEAMDRIREISTDVAILLSSGYSSQDLPALANDPNHATLIPKPYTPSHLLREVRKALDANIPKALATDIDPAAYKPQPVPGGGNHNDN